MPERMTRAYLENLRSVVEDMSSFDNETVWLRDLISEVDILRRALQLARAYYESTIDEWPGEAIDSALGDTGWICDACGEDYRDGGTCSAHPKDKTDA